MNPFLQQEDYLIGSKDEIKKLSQKSSIRILAISDSHGQEFILKNIIDKFSTDIDLLAFCGDGALDLLHYIENAKKNKSLQKAFPPVLAIAQGNGDDDIYALNFNPSEKDKAKNQWEYRIPKAVIVKIAGTNILVTHGHIYGISYETKELDSFAKTNNASLTIFGHTHISEIQKEKHTTLINPGSCSSPRRNLPPSFAIITLDGKTKKIESTFYQINISLQNGITFDSFLPPKTNFREY